MIRPNLEFFLGVTCAKMFANTTVKRCAFQHFHGFSINKYGYKHFLT